MTRHLLMHEAVAKPFPGLSVAVMIVADSVWSAYPAKISEAGGFTLDTNTDCSQLQVPDGVQYNPIEMPRDPIEQSPQVQPIRVRYVAKCNCKIGQCGCDEVAVLYSSDYSPDGNVKKMGDERYSFTVIPVTSAQAVHRARTIRSVISCGNVLAKVAFEPSWTRDPVLAYTQYGAHYANVGTSEAQGLTLVSWADLHVPIHVLKRLTHGSESLQRFLATRSAQLLSNACSVHKQLRAPVRDPTIVPTLQAIKFSRSGLPAVIEVLLVKAMKTDRVIYDPAPVSAPRKDHTQPWSSGSILAAPPLDDPREILSALTRVEDECLTRACRAGKKQPLRLCLAIPLCRTTHRWLAYHRERLHLLLKFRAESATTNHGINQVRPYVATEESTSVITVGVFWVVNYAMQTNGSREHWQSLRSLLQLPVVLSPLADLLSNIVNPESATKILPRAHTLAPEKTDPYQKAHRTYHRDILATVSAVGPAANVSTTEPLGVHTRQLTNSAEQLEKFSPLPDRHLSQALPRSSRTSPIGIDQSALRMTPWHSLMQTLVPHNRTEKSSPVRSLAWRVDVHNNGVAIEFESVPPIIETARARESRFTNLVWVINMTQLRDGMRVVQPGIPTYLEWDKPLQVDRYRLGTTFSVQLVFAKVLRQLRCEQWWDIGLQDGLLLVNSISECRHSADITPVRWETFLKKYCDPVWIRETYQGRSPFSSRVATIRSWAALSGVEVTDTTAMPTPTLDTTSASFPKPAPLEEIHWLRSATDLTHQIAGKNTITRYRTTWKAVLKHMSSSPRPVIAPQIDLCAQPIPLPTIVTDPDFRRRLNLNLSARILETGSPPTDVLAQDLSDILQDSIIESLCGEAKTKYLKLRRFRQNRECNLVSQTDQRCHLLRSIQQRAVNDAHPCLHTGGPDPAPHIADSKAYINLIRADPSAAMPDSLLSIGRLGTALSDEQSKDWSSWLLDIHRRRQSRAFQVAWTQRRDEAELLEKSASEFQTQFDNNPKAAIRELQQGGQVLASPSLENQGAHFDVIFARREPSDYRDDEAEAELPVCIIAKWNLRDISSHRDHTKFLCPSPPPRPAITPKPYTSPNALTENSTPLQRQARKETKMKKLRDIMSEPSPPIRVRTDQDRRHALGVESIRSPRNFAKEKGLTPGNKWGGQILFVGNEIAAWTANILHTVRVSLALIPSILDKIPSPSRIPVLLEINTATFEHVGQVRPWQGLSEVFRVALQYLHPSNRAAHSPMTHQTEVRTLTNCVLASVILGQWKLDSTDQIMGLKPASALTDLLNGQWRHQCEWIQPSGFPDVVMRAITNLDNSAIDHIHRLTQLLSSVVTWLRSRHDVAVCPLEIVTLTIAAWTDRHIRNHAHLRLDLLQPIASVLVHHGFPTPSPCTPGSGVSLNLHKGSLTLSVSATTIEPLAWFPLVRDALADERGWAANDGSANKSQSLGSASAIVIGNNQLSITLLAANATSGTMEVVSATSAVQTAKLLKCTGITVITG